MMDEHGNSEAGPPGAAEQIRQLSDADLIGYMEYVRRRFSSTARKVRADAVNLRSMVAECDARGLPAKLRLHPEELDALLAITAERDRAN
jgi:hypothetical protein